MAALDRKYQSGIGANLTVADLRSSIAGYDDQAPVEFLVHWPDMHTGVGAKLLQTSQTKVNNKDASVLVEVVLEGN